MPPVSPFDIARAHVRLPINRDYGALKQALRDWLVYTERTKLEEKETFPAALRIEVRRPSPSSLLRGASSRASLSSSFASRLGAWKRRYGNGTDENKGGATAADRAEEASHLYTSYVPLSLYTALLPWEVQRGLSQATLTRSLQEREDAAAAAEAEEAAQQQEEQQHAGAGHSDAAPTQSEGEGEADPFGVVTSSRTPQGEVSHGALAGTAGAPRQPPSEEAQSSWHSSSTSTGPKAPVPGMLFVLDLQGVREAGGQIGFWSGAITRAIDVLFFSPTEVSSVAQSASLRRLRERDVQMLVDGNEVSPAVVARFFPRNELRSAGRYTLRLHTYGHLDPFPWCEDGDTPANAKAPVEEGQMEGASANHTEELCHSVEAPLTRENKADAATLPRLVLETIRHTVSTGVQQALAASLADYQHVYGDEGVAVLEATTTDPHHHPNRTGSGQSHRKADDTDVADLEISLELSDALVENLMNKAQLHAHYVEMLEDAVRSYATALSRPRHSDAAAEPLHQDAVEDHREEDGGAGDARRMQVWLSETEQVWMTPSELAAFQREQTHKHTQTPWEAATTQAEAAAAQQEQEDDDAFMSAAAAEAEEHLSENAEQHLSHMSRRADSTTDMVQSHQGRDDAMRSSPSAPSSPSFVTPMRDGDVRPDRSLSHQSPQLREEDEGRPSVLVPSFTGRHEASTLHSLAPQLSADKLARYPRTRSDMPTLPPIDYELFDLCLRLGVGQSTVLYHYYERILREWRHALKNLRGTRTAADTTSEETDIDEATMQRMQALVHDPSLQVPEELRSLVDAVWKARKKRQQAESV